MSYPTWWRHILLDDVISYLVMSYPTVLSQDLFFSFIWNNFLHTQIEICISNILTKKDAGGTESPRALQAEQTENLTPTMLTQEEDTPLVTHVSILTGLLVYDTNFLGFHPYL